MIEISCVSNGTNPALYFDDIMVLRIYEDGSDTVAEKSSLAL
jgi:hypothetical protein